MPYDDYEVEDFGEYGAAVGQGQDEFGTEPVGQGQDEMGASPRALMSLSRSLRRGARSGRISRRGMAQAARSQASRCKGGNFPWGGAGFGPPVGPGTGSYGMPLGLGVAAVAVAGNAFQLQQANNRGVPLRIKRLILETTVDATTTPVGGFVVTGINVGDFPILTGAQVPALVFGPGNFSPVSYNQLLYPGTNFTVTGTSGALPAVTIAGSCEVSQL